jgi:CubicO group peptidase (beta-lactamase class C family)
MTASNFQARHKQMMQFRRSAAYAAWAAVALLSGVRPAAAQQEPYPGLDAYITKALAASNVPGISVAIVRNDSVIYAKGFGARAKGSSALVNDQTLFEIGSSSKSFTATLVAMMVSDGKMKYDDLVSKYLPDFKLYDPIASAQVTIRDALTHKSGIGRGESMWIDMGTSREDVLHRVRFLKPESNFRSKYSYQNIMVLAAGEAAGKAGGSTWEDLVQKRIFNELGMMASAPVYRMLKDRSNLASPHAVEHDTVYTKEAFNGENIAPAGSVVSTARDMAQWLRFHMNDGVVNGKRLVSSAALRETHIPQTLIGGGGGGGGEGGGSNFRTYGMGWFVGDYRHELQWDHGGNTPGMTAAMGMLPEKKIGVVVLSNMDHAGLPGQIMHYIFDRQLGVPEREVAGGRGGRGGGAAGARQPDTTAAAAHVAVAAPLPLAAYVGTYADSLYGDVTVVIESGHLVLTRGLASGPLEYTNANNFHWSNNGSIRTLINNIKFEVTPDNKVTGVYYGTAPDINLLGRKNTAGGGRGGRGGGQ